MILLMRKGEWVPETCFKMTLIALLTHFFGIGWGLIAIATINLLPSIKINLS